MWVGLPRPGISMGSAALLAAAAWIGCSTGGGAERAPARAPSPVPSPAPAARAAEEPTLPLLRIGTSGDYAPFSKAGSGFDIEVGKRLAQEFGYRVEWVPFAWPELKAKIATNAFDVAMSGVTWRPDRSLVGYMTRPVAIGGPCVLGSAAPQRVAVNRGGVLERWARERFAAAQLQTVDDNLALPALLERGEVDAIVTDSFEAEHFAKPGWERRCEPPRDRKVYWVSPARADELGPRIDRWLAAHERDLDAMRATWFGRHSNLGETQHLVDLLERRLALMPMVAAYKRARGQPIEDRTREAVVLQQSMDGAAALGLSKESVRALFAEQIELSKAVQARADATEVIDLDTVLRPELSRLGARILAALAASAPQLSQLRAEELDLLEPWLQPRERERLLAALRAVRPQTAARVAPAAPAVQPSAAP